MFASWIGVVISRTFGSWRRIKEMVQDLQCQSREEKAIEQLNREQGHFTLTLWGQPSSFPFEQGRWNVVVGETGSGKSTLLTSYATLMKSRRESIAYVAQEPYLYSDTIQRNIFLGHTPSEREQQRARELLQLFQLDSLGPSLDAIMELEVGENGKRVSADKPSAFASSAA